MKIKLLELDLWLDKKAGWFFTNGRKQHVWISRIKKKEKELKKLKKIQNIIKNDK
jgi:hypothetical protein